MGPLKNRQAPPVSRSTFAQSAPGKSAVMIRFSLPRTSGWQAQFTTVATARPSRPLNRKAARSGSMTAGSRRSRQSPLGSKVPCQPATLASLSRASRARRAAATFLLSSPIQALSTPESPGSGPQSPMVSGPECTWVAATKR
jgi:hypothetical protein